MVVWKYDQSSLPCHFETIHNPTSLFFLFFFSFFGCAIHFWVEFKAISSAILKYLL
jgi:hypothetical protein